MKSLTLGLNFFGGHDTSLFMMTEEGDCYGLSQERVTRIKHDAIFPIDAIGEMLRDRRIDPAGVTSLSVGVATQAFADRMLHEYSYEMTTALREMLRGDRDRLYIKAFVAGKERLQQASAIGKMGAFLSSPHGRRYLRMQIMGRKRPLRELVQRHLSRIFPHAQIGITFCEHHLAHAYSAYYSSGFDHALVFTFDGEGDGCFSKLYDVHAGDFEQIGESRNRFVPNMQRYDFADSGYSSVGNLYSIFTHLLGFTPNADEGKVEALAAFGAWDNALYAMLMDAHRVDSDTLSIEIDTDRLNRLFETEQLAHIMRMLTREDIAAAVQHFTEEIMLSCLRAVRARYGDRNLVLAGGVTANVIANMKIFENLFENLYIVPAMGDDGIAQGACVMQYLERHPSRRERFRFPRMPYYGSAYTKEEVEEVLSESGLSYRWMGEEAYLKAAEAITQGEIGALFHGRAEFGPRALGNRSIIADVRNEEIQKHINKEIKRRPLFQPFCPSILESERERLFEKSYDNRHMTIAFRLKEAHREAIPGAVHVDLTARVQFVTEEDNPNYYRLISEVKRRTGYGVIINTSFNKHGRTMVLTPADAVRDFVDTNLDFMVMEGYWVTRG